MSILSLSIAVYSKEKKRLIGEVNTAFKLVGPDHKVVVEAFEDPSVPGVTCYLSRAKTGGVTGGLGLAEDPARMGISCVQTGTIDKTKLPASNSSELVFKENQSLVFKELRINRFYDEDRGVLVYLIWSTKLIDGSPYNAVSVVPVK